MRCVLFHRAAMQCFHRLVGIDITDIIDALDVQVQNLSTNPVMVNGRRFFRISAV